MAKSLKITLMVLAAFVILIAIAAISIKLYFTSDRLKALIIPKVEEQLHRQVSVADVSLSLFPNLAVKMQNLAISNPQGLQFDRDEFFSLKSLVLDVNLLPLLRKKLDVKQVILSEPRAYLEVNKAGRSNFEMPKGETPAEPPDGVLANGTSAAAFSLLLSNLQIEDGTIEYMDRKTDQHILLLGLNQKMRANVTNRGQDVFFEGQVSVKGLSYGSAKRFLVSDLPIESYQQFSYQGAQDLLLVDSVEVRIREIGLVLKGSVTNLKKAPVLDLSLKSTRADIEQVLSLVPPEFLKASQGLTSSGDFQFDMTIKGEVSENRQPAIQGTFAVTDGSISYKGLPKSITEINVSGSFVQPAAALQKPQSGQVRIDKFAAALGSNSLSGSLSLVDLDDPRLSVSLEGELSLDEIKDYYPLEEGTELSGSLKANLSLDGKVSDPTKIRANGQLEFRDVTIRTAALAQPLQSLNGAIVFNNQIIEAKELLMVIGLSDLGISFTMRNYLSLISKEAGARQKPHATLTLNSRQLRTADFTTEAKAASPDKKSPPKKGLLLPEINADANVTIGKLSLEKFEFTDVRGAVKIQDRLVDLQNLSLKAFEGTASTKGTLDLRSQNKLPFNLNLDVAGAEANMMLSNFTSFGDHLFGKLSLRTALKGELNDTLGLNPQSLNGEGSAQFQQGRLVGYPVTLKLAEFTGISAFSQVNFQNWKSTYRIADGRIHFDDFKFTSAETDFVVGGSQGFDGTLDYTLLVRLPEKLYSKLKISGLAADMLQYLKDKDGKVGLHLLVKGTSAKPVITLDTKQIEKAAKQALEKKAQEQLNQAQDEARKKLEEELKKKSQDALKKLFGP